MSGREGWLAASLGINSQLRALILVTGTSSNVNTQLAETCLWACGLTELSKTKNTIKM